MIKTNRRKHHNNMSPHPPVNQTIISTAQLLVFACNNTREIPNQRNNRDFKQSNSVRHMHFLDLNYKITNNYRSPIVESKYTLHNRSWLLRDANNQITRYKLINQAGASVLNTQRHEASIHFI